MAPRRSERADAEFRAQAGWPRIKMGLGVLLLAAGAAALAWELLPARFGVVTAALGAVTVLAAAYDRGWSLRLDSRGVTLRRWGGRRHIPWDDVAFVRVEPSGVRSRTVVVVLGAVPGTPSPEIRFQVDRLSAADRRRLGEELAARGHPMVPGEA